jgi:hypothetical protein
MPPGVWNLEWLNENSQRSYPLTEEATKTDITQEFELPDDFLLALYFPVHAGEDVQPGNFFLYKLAIFGTGFNIVIGYDNGTSTPVTVASAIIARATHTEYLSYALPGQGDFDDSVGRLVIGRLNSIDALAPGQYEFAYEDGQLEIDAIRPMIRGVQGLVLLNGTDRSDRLYGDIELQAGNNIKLTPVLVTGENPVVRIDAIDGEGLSDDCVCDDESEAPAIRTINGIPPTAAGDFTLQGDTCIEIQAITNGVKLVDKCSEPCCDCEDLQALTQELITLGDAATTYRGFTNRLQEEVTQMSQVVLGSLLSDQGCITGDCT